MFAGCGKQTTIKQEPKEKPTISDTNKKIPLVSDTNSIKNTLPPKIVFDETLVDFGKAGPNTKLKKELKFHNAGKGVLQIYEITQCCGVFAYVDKDQYEPGEDGILTFDFTPPGVIGLFERNPTVISNDPINPELVLDLKVDIIQIVVWDPVNIKLFVDEENGACPQLKIHSIDNKAFAITGLRSTGNCITADYNPLDKKTEHILDLKVNMEKIPESLAGTIDIMMDHPNGNIASIPFNVIPKYEFSPKPVYEFDMKENQPRVITIKLINNYKKDISIVSTSSREKTIELVDYKKTGDDYEINIKITPPPQKNGELRFNDMFYVDLSDGEQLALSCMEYYIIEK